MSFCKQLLNSLLLLVAAFVCPALLHAQSDFTGIIEKDGKYGIEIKVEGGTKQVVKPKYDALKVLYGNTFPDVYAYKLEGKWGLIYREGKGVATVTKPEYDDIKLLNNKANYVFDLREQYFLVWKAGKVALLSYPNDGNVKLSQFWDDIGIDTVKFAVNYLSMFKIKAGNLYGVADLFGRVVVKPEYESYEKLEANGYNYFHLLKKDHRYLIVLDKKKVYGEELRPADTAWYDKELFSITGKDTVVHYPYGTETISTYRKKQAEYDAYMQAKGLKDDAQKQKQEKAKNILSMSYQKKQRVFLSSTKEMYLLIDSFGIKCFDPEKAEYVFADKQLEHYYINNNLVFVQSVQGKWYLYPNTVMEFKSIKTVHPYVAAQVSDEQYWIFGGVNSSQVYVEKGAEITEVTKLDNSVYVVYRLNGKYGFVSQDNSGYPLKKLPAVFTSISVISTYQNTARLQLVYDGETVNAYHNDIQMAFGGKHTGIKADMYGAACGNPKCKNGVIGTTTRVEKGETVTKRFNNTTYWYKGHLVPADITVTETNPDRVITEKEYCKDPIHSVKTVMLFWDNSIGTYKVEKH